MVNEKNNSIRSRAVGRSENPAVQVDVKGIGRGVIKSEKWADVVYGWPLT